MSKKQFNCLIMIKKEAKRFLEKVDKAIDRDRKEIAASSFLYSSGEMAAVKRSSLDLSKMLSEFRKIGGAK